MFMYSRHNLRTHVGLKLALVVYEYMLKFRDEVELFWSGKAGAARVLFLTNRYLTLLYSVTRFLCASTNVCTLSHRTSLLD